MEVQIESIDSSSAHIRLGLLSSLTWLKTTLAHVILTYGSSTAGRRTDDADFEMASAWLHQMHCWFPLNWTRKSMKYSQNSYYQNPGYYKRSQWQLFTYFSNLFFCLPPSGLAIRANISLFSCWLSPDAVSSRYHGSGTHFLSIAEVVHPWWLSRSDYFGRWHSILWAKHRYGQVVFWSDSGHKVRGLIQITRSEMVILAEPTHGLLSPA